MGTRYRAKISKKNKYWISKHRYYEIVHFCLQYKEWKDEYTALSNQGIRAVEYDGMPHGTEVGQPTESMAVRLAQLRDKIDVVEKTVMDTEPELAIYLLNAVTNEGVTYNYLRQIMGIPCGKNVYYEARRKFYWLMSQKI